MKLLLSLSTLLLLSLTTIGAEIEWITIQEAEKRNKTEARPILIDIYTDWCGWCKELDKKTYADPIIIDYINEHYWAVKFNPETSGTFTFNGEEYGKDELEGTPFHEFEVFISEKPLSYPTTAFLTSDNQQFASWGGFLEKDKMHLLLSVVRLGKEASEEDVAAFLENYSSPYPSEESEWEEAEEETNTVQLYEGEEINELGVIQNLSHKRYFNPKFEMYALAVEEEYSLPAEIILALGAYYSDFGNNDMARFTNNHFSLTIYKDWDWGTYKTAEGTVYRVYPSVEESYNDVAQYILKNYRIPKKFLNADKSYEEWTQLLVKVGYINQDEMAELNEIIIKYQLENVQTM
ncbi:glucosaminidase domain-containing protein [Flammeovirga sp. SubArs3]|uniref:glucosaminidase domain-containing protein n=1 Tax=Flammeovirga sp. SubArs3 TaxID=2995316 RepID=UPI00248BB6CA|nr:glucosaminidase domain-containing protein [Flammeovirga sp. SubArs3]